MKRIYFKTAIRNIKRNRLYSFINFLCLSIGITVMVISASYIEFETSFDNFHANKENKYRLLSTDLSDNSLHAQHSGYFLPFFKNIPEIKNIVLLHIANEGSVKHNDKTFKENLYFADSTFFDFFNFELTQGSYESFSDPENAFITEETAKKYFNDEDPVGKVLLYNNRLKLKVAGVLKNVPENSHLQFNIIAPATALMKKKSNKLNTLQNSVCLYYIELNSEANPEAVAAKFNEPYKGIYSPEELKNLSHVLQPLSKIYLHSDTILWDDIKKGNVTHVYSISIAAILVLLISCFNYINISLSLLSKRSREVGIKKVVGAKRKQLIMQFFVETFVITFFSVWFAVLLSEILKPFINNFFGTSIPLGYDLKFALLTILFLIVLPLIIGLYPAILYASFKPIDLFRKGNIFSIKTKKRKVIKIGFRELLLILQFTISAILIISTISVTKQINFLKNNSLGYDKKDRIVVQNPFAQGLNSRYKALKQKCLENPAIESVCGCFNYPSSGLNFSSELESIDSVNKKTLEVGVTSIDVDFFKTVDAHIIEGRNFSKEFATDTSTSIILNETAAKELNIKGSVLGYKLKGIKKERIYNVIGVAEDIHFFSKKEKMTPMVYVSTAYEFPYYSCHAIVKAKPGKYKETLSFLKEEMETLAPNYPFTYFDLEASTDSHYKNEQRMFMFFCVLALLAVLLSSLGIISLVLLNLEKKNKEIAIRRVTGASLSSIINLINKDFSLIVIIGLVIAFPLAYLIIEAWLSNFAYRISTPWLFYLLSGIVIYMISFLCVFAQSLRISKINPVEALKYE